MKPCPKITRCTDVPLSLLKIIGHDTSLKPSHFFITTSLLERETQSKFGIAMPIPLVAEVFVEGLNKIPYAYTLLKALPWFLVIYGLKAYFGGKSNRSERVMHSKVVMITVSPHSTFAEIEDTILIT
jgi:hypothetical protein